MTNGTADPPEAGKVELKARFVELRAKGYSYARIARQLRVAKGTLANWHAQLAGEGGLAVQFDCGHATAAGLVPRGFRPIPGTYREDSD